MYVYKMIYIDESELEMTFLIYEEDYFVGKIIIEPSEDRTLPDAPLISGLL